MVGKPLLRGMLVGLVAGLLMNCCASAVSRPSRLRGRLTGAIAPM